MRKSSRSHQPAKKLRGRGRPTKFHASLCDRVLLYGRLGKSRHQIASLLAICWETLRTWEREHPDFLASMTRARELALAWWEDAGQKGIWSRDFNANGYRLQICNRFPDDWSDAPTVSITNSVTIENKPADQLGGRELRELARKRGLIPEIVGRKELTE